MLGALYWAASQLHLPALADGGYEGAGQGVHLPFKRPGDGNVRRSITWPTTRYSALCAHWANAASPLLTTRWRPPQRITASPSRIGDLVAAGMMLTHFEQRDLRRSCCDHSLSPLQPR